MCLYIYICIYIHTCMYFRYSGPTLGFFWSPALVSLGSQMAKSCQELNAREVVAPWLRSMAPSSGRLVWYTQSPNPYPPQY